MATFRMGKKCVYTGCLNTRNSPKGISMFRFPVKDKDRCLEWILKSGNDKLLELSDNELRNHVICSHHFEVNDFKNNLLNSLNYFAVPRMFTPRESPPLSEQSFIKSDTVSNPCPLSKHEEHISAANSQTGHVGDKFQTSLVLSGPDDAVQIETVDCAKESAPVESGDNTPRKAKLRAKLRKQVLLLNRKRSQLHFKRKKKDKLPVADLLLQLNEHLSGHPLTLLKMQLNHKKRVPWEQDEKEFAMATFYRSPSLYRTWLKQGFKLPSEKTVRKWVNIMNLSPGITSEVKEKLKLKVDCMSEHEKECILIFDEMAIKKWLSYNSKTDEEEGRQDLGELGRNKSLASQALVFMVRGLLYSWKMPFSYYLSCGTVRHFDLMILLDLVLEALTEIGLHVRAIACDQGTSNQKVIEGLGVSEDKPYFMFKQRKIFVVFDVPHLLKCVRNNLMANDFVVDREVVTWRAIANLASCDSKSKLARAVPKLSQRHVMPNAFDKMNVKLAAQIFSQSVFSALMAYATVDGGCENQPETIATAKFVEKMNNLFDNLNSRSTNDPNPHRQPLSNENDLVLKNIKESIAWIGRWSMKDNRKKCPPTFKNFRLTLKSILLLWDDLSNEGVHFLLTSRLHQDPLESLFSVIRQRVGYGRNPSSQQFRQFLQHNMSVRLIVPPQSANCEGDDDNMLLASGLSTSYINIDGIGSGISDLSAVSTSSCLTDVCRGDSTCEKYEEIPATNMCSYVVSKPFSAPVFPTLHEESKDDTLEDCAVYYFAGYTAKKCLDKFRCQSCEDFLTDSSNVSQKCKALNYFKTYVTHDATYPQNLTESHLTSASNILNEVTRFQLGLFSQCYENFCYKRRISFLVQAYITEETKKAFPTWFGPCSNHKEFLLRTLVRCRIFYEVKWRSRQERDSKRNNTVVKGHCKLKKLKHQ